MPKAIILLGTPSDILISVMFGLIRSFDRYADVIGLLLSPFGQFDADALPVEAGNFFVSAGGRHLPRKALSINPSGPRPGW